MIITISGKAGSGKSTIAKLVAEKLKLKVAIIGGDLNDLKDFLEGKKFKGTVIAQT